MDLEKVTESDLVGRFFIWDPDVPDIKDRLNIRGYYGIVNRLRPLFKNLQTQQNISSYFLNHIKNETTNNKDTVRLTYFVSIESIPSTIELIEKYLNDNKLVEHCSREYPHIDEGMPLKFRRFVTLNTPIGLDIMDGKKLQNARHLVAKYIFQARPTNPTNSQIRHHFEQTFRDNSDTYKSLSKEDTDFYWMNFSKYDKKLRATFEHFLVNLVVGFDVNFPHPCSDEFIDSILEADTFLVKRG